MGIENMKKNFIKTLLALFIALSIPSMAFAESIAVVDVNKVVAASKQVQDLKNEHLKKNQDLRKWLDVVRADIDKQSTEANKQKLAQKYNAELNKRKTALQKEYAQKIGDIEKNISASITQQAKAMGYSMVMAKSNVLYGGTDITDAVMKVVK